jgi:NAD(P)-dependent dehydrogenase (short-subunit alcohol dehydrogenase family)
MKTIVITGGTSGIGRALVEYFAANAYGVVFTGRNREKANEILNKLADKEMNFIEADFASFDSVVNASNEIKAKYPNIDILINNVGVWEMQYKETADGIETNFAVNHLAPMLFTLKLLPNINQETGRIINTSSGAHRRNILDLHDIEWKNKPYDGVATYSQSKLCNILFANQLAEELKQTRILVNTVHPGYVKTDLFQNMGNRNWDGVKDAFDGARSAIFASENNTIVNQSKLYIYRENTDPNISRVANDMTLAKKLWDLSMNYLNKYL